MPQKNPLEQNSSDFSLKNLPKPQKIAVIFLFILAVLVVVFWIIQMRSHINRPFDYGLSSGSGAKELDYIEALSKSDIDQDGISDYDEIYVYQTSPYLEDSDSDGLSDKQEITQGSDPNCPQGQDCNSAEVLIDTTKTIDDTDNSGTADQTPSAGLDSNSLDQTILQQALSGTIDAATLRQLLIESGADASLLNEISDEDLMKGYQETLSSQSLGDQ